MGDWTRAVIIERFHPPKIEHSSTQINAEARIEVRTKGGRAHRYPSWRFHPPQIGAWILESSWPPSSPVSSCSTTEEREPRVMSPPPATAAIGVPISAEGQDTSGGGRRAEGQDASGGGRRPIPRDGAVQLLVHLPSKF